MSAWTAEQAVKGAELLKAADRVDRAFVALRLALKRREKAARELRDLGYSAAPLPSKREVTLAAYRHGIAPLLRLECMSQRHARSMVAADALALSFLPVSPPAPSTTRGTRSRRAGLPEVAA
ncbi:hypothetical protein KPL78_06530 [Roseomonas sp. HJA6]|uniref:Uncharacterized protein n=1 Tax=Roseomonas alba TaxID=2846776 RepID=A0ABS7A5D1_9PROT|nr:hypothetical protein [Neoroseomonas alba]MBW6397494.1 hypothetical protein [Neoroseomonas alba]